MKHWIVLSAILLLGLAAIVLGEKKKVNVPAGPDAILYLVADTEQEITRMPVNFTRISDAEEIRIGDQLASYYGGSDKKTNETIEIENYLKLVGSKLAPHAQRRLPYSFHYVPDRNFVNAFALPGGHVFVGGGLLALMDSEDELASVLSHEIEHIDHYHCAERVQRERALRKLPFGELISIPMEVFAAGYSKDQELEADREGTRLAVQAGYSATGAMRMFETFQRLYDEYELKAKTPEQELSNIAQKTLEGYFRSHPLPGERIAQIQTLIASEHWQPRSERDLAVAYFFWTQKAEDALKTGRYAQAQQIATRSLQVKAGRNDALEILARAQFAQAEFGEASASWRKLLDMQPENSEYANQYALSLASSNRATALGEFQRWRNSLGENRPVYLEVPASGLALLAGDQAPARNAVTSARENLTGDLGPGWLADLAWWYYLAGDHGTALDLINDAVQERPDEQRYKIRQAWIQIENRRLADALNTLLSVNMYEPATGDSAMTRAVASWQAKEHDQAIGLFKTAVQFHPEWTNAHWVKPLYSPSVLRSIDEMQAEIERRKKAQAAQLR